MANDPHFRSSRISRAAWRPVEVFRPLVLVLVGLIIVVLWGWLRGAESRALASMDPDLRGELFRRSRAEAESLCARPELEEECRSRLGFLEQFPECDPSCRAFLAAHRRPPTR